MKTNNTYLLRYCLSKHRLCICTAACQGYTAPETPKKGDLMNEEKSTSDIVLS